MMTNVVSLFDQSAYMVKPWAQAGFACHCFDLENKAKREGTISWHCWDALEGLAPVLDLSPLIIFGFPPCTDLAASGAKHFEKKAEKNSAFQQDALALVSCVEAAGNAAAAPWLVENPVGSLSALWRTPDYIYDPYEYGGYLSDEPHPEFPKYIAAQDAYRKTTCIWHGNGMQRPKTKPILPWIGASRQTKLLGGTSAKTKYIRSLTPRGFAQAIFEANVKLVQALALERQAC